MQTQRTHEGMTTANQAKPHSNLPCIEEDSCSAVAESIGRGQLLSPAELKNHAHPAPNKE